ncbi:sensor histidine kinase [Pseudoscardovia radai]|uniref:sensor histidine kinase n=1 Tax=Pseudoscardovia radai TaxID=987066 RepID=UPI003993A2F8
MREAEATQQAAQQNGPTAFMPSDEAAHTLGTSSCTGADDSQSAAGPAPAPAPKKTKNAQDGKSRRTIKQRIAHGFDSMSLSFKLVSMVILVVLLAECVLGIAIRRLVGQYILDKTDNQLSQQAQLVFNNYQQLLGNGPSPRSYSLTDYFLQIRDTDGDIISTMTPSMRDGIVSQPNLDSLDLTAVDYSEPFTVPASVTVPDGVQISAKELASAKQDWRVEAFQIIRAGDPGSSSQQSDGGGYNNSDYTGSGTGAANSADGSTAASTVSSVMDAADTYATATQNAEDSYVASDAMAFDAVASDGVTLKAVDTSVTPSDVDTLNTYFADSGIVASTAGDATASSQGTVIGIAYIGLSLRDVYETTDMITQYFAIAGICTLLAAGALAIMFTRGALLPLKRMEKTAAKIAAGDLSERVQDLPPNTEVGSLAASLNTMLVQIERSFKEQEKTTSKMKQFVSDASHELRTPLATIHGYAELYKMQRAATDGKNPEQILGYADDAIDHIEHSSERMSALVEDLLSLARLDEGRGIEFKPGVRMDEIISGSAEDLHALDPERTVRMGSVDVTGSVPPVEGADGSDDAVRFDITDAPMPVVSMVGDSMRLHQVLTNIIGNIHRYTPADSPVELGATVVMAPDGGDLAEKPSTEGSLYEFIESLGQQTTDKPWRQYAVVVVNDHGPGMKPDQRERIFERFYTADPSRARLKGGTGLGMAIVQSVVKAHHGLICATRTPGGGLTYSIVIPVDAGQEPGRPAVQPQRNREANGGGRAK